MNLQQLIKFGLENSQEPVIKNPVLREALVGTPTKEVTQFDKRIYETPEGERVSEKSTTFFLNGKWLNVPTIHNGRSFTEDQLRLMIKQGQIQPTSVHGSRNEAEEAAASRSNMMKSHVKGFDEGGQVIGKPGGLVEPGVEYYAKKKKKWEASVYKGEETQISKVRKYFDGLPKDSKIVIKDVGKELNMNRHTIDEILKEKKYKNKFKVLRTADYLDNTGFTMEYANFVDSDYFDTGADKEFAEFLNDKGFKNSKGGNFTSKSIYSRRLRGDIESGSIFKPRNEKEVLQEAKRLEIKNYKSLSPEKLREKVRAHLKYETMAFKTKNDPKFRKQRAEYNKKRRAILMEDPEYHAKEKIRKKKLRAKQYLKWGANPPSDTPEQALWNDFVNAAKKNDRLSLKTKLPKKRPRKVMDEIILIDNVTDKEITFGKDGKNLKNYLNTHKESFGITGADESLKPYRQKFFINDEPYLKHNINMALLGEKKGSLTAIQIQHDAGMAKNPAKVSLAFWDDNIKEHYARAEFDKAWDNAYEIKDGKKKLSYSKAKEAFNIFKTDLEKLNITSMPKMVDRFRTYGKGLGLEQALKIAKEKGAIVPSETLKKAKSFSNTLEKALTQAGFPIDKCLSSGGRVGFANTGFVGGIDKCISGVLEEEQAKAMKGNKISKGKFGKFGKFARTAGWFLGPVDIPIELAFALPHMLAGDKEAAKRATTLGLFGWGKDKREEIKESSPEAYKYIKHVEDTADYVDTWFKNQDLNEDKKLLLEQQANIPEDRKELFSGVLEKQREDLENQIIDTEETMNRIHEGYKGYDSIYEAAKGKNVFKDYIIQDVIEKTDKGLDMKEYGGTGMNIALGLPWDFGMKKGIAPFKGGKPITNLKQHIAQKGQDYYKQLEHAAYESGKAGEGLFDQYFTTADVKDPREAYTELPTKYASQLAALEKEEMLRGLKAKGLHGTVGFKKMLEAQGIDPQEVWDVGKEDWEFDILGKRHLRASGGRAGYTNGGIASLMKKKW